MKKTLTVLLFLSLLLSCASCIAEAPSDDPVTTNTESSESPTHESDETELSPDGSASSEDGTDTEAVTEPTLQYPAVIYTVSTLHVTDEDIEIRNDVKSMNFGMSQSTDMLDLEKGTCQFTVNGSEHTLTYTRTFMYRYEDCSETVKRNYSRDEYEDDEGNTYEFYEGTRLVGRFQKKDGDPAPGYEKKTKKQMTDIAKKTILQFSGIDVDANEAFEEYSSFTDGATFWYTYTFCGYETNQEIYLRMNPAGEVMEYKHTHALLYREWEGVLTENDILRAADTVHYPSDMGAGNLTQSITVGNDGYLYVKLSMMEFAYDETDAEGNVVMEHPVHFTEHYVRVTPTP